MPFEAFLARAHSFPRLAEAFLRSADLFPKPAEVFPGSADRFPGGVHYFQAVQGYCPYRRFPAELLWADMQVRPYARPRGRGRGAEENR